MITFTKPENLNGTELRDELRIAGIKITDDILAVALVENDLILDIDSKDEIKAKDIVASHNGNIEPKKATLEDKLASVGLSLADLKTALGL